MKEQFIEFDTEGEQNLWRMKLDPERKEVVCTRTTGGDKGVRGYDLEGRMKWSSPALDHDEYAHLEMS